MRVTFPSYIGGTQIRTNKFIVRSTELALAMNVSSKILGSWISRNGYTKTGNTLQSGKSVDGLFGDQNVGGHHLGVINNSDDSYSSLKYNNSGTWTDISGATTLPADTQVNFASFLDKTYIFGKSDSSFMTTADISGTTYSQQSAFPKAAYGLVFFDKLFLFNCEVDGTSYQSRGYYSSIPEYTGGNWEITFTTETDFLQLSTGDGDYITGAAKSYGRLLVFKNYSIHSWDQSNLMQIDGKGCTSPKSLVSDDDKDVYWHHYSSKRKGIYKWDGETAKKISRPIDPFIEGSTGTGVVGGIYNDHIYQFIGNVTLDPDISEYYGIPSSYNNVLLDYSIQDEFWTIHTLADSISSIAPYDNDLYLGSASGDVYKWDYGDTDDGTPIESIIITENFYGLDQSEYNLRKTWLENTINMHKCNGSKSYYSIDNSDWKPIGQLKNKVNNLSISGKGYGIKTKIASIGSNFIFEGNEYLYDLEKPVRSK